MNFPFAATVVAPGTESAWGLGVIAVTGLAVLAYVVFFVGALISILGSSQSFGMKVVWIIFAFCAPFLGPLLWFLVGRKQDVRTPA
ncbi:PLD nuclease N-terminal domain-containing protein [Saccharopolyspora sp. K220]|uniref:PLD nuclease N-terminal domain-containing protein n=1 Tax=Saccharopolyspora soli TaxID=2926618 RepID=UPI001F577E2B|nr:PLD nuclease N-terminal domain-containing protein [Saccharopolyspora soli]MCI2418440.1 PLD nuclease N-terminal domain-containing protein [Saccharopolyspora soli]